MYKKSFNFFSWYPEERKNIAQWIFFATLPLSLPFVRFYLGTKRSADLMVEKSTIFNYVYQPLASLMIKYDMFFLLQSIYFLIFGFQCDVFSQSRRIRNEELLTDYICSFFTRIFALWAFQCVEIIFGGSLQWRQRHFWYWRDFQTQQSASTLFEY